MTFEHALFRRLVIMAMQAAAFVALGIGVAVVVHSAFVSWIVLALVVCVGIAIGRSRRWRGSEYAHGTARWADAADLSHAGVLGGSGVLLGHTLASGPPSFASLVRLLWTTPFRSSVAVMEIFENAKHHRRGRPIRIRNFVHLATFAPTGRGKGTCVLIPNLLAYPESVVVIDPKGENWQITAEYRKRYFGHRIVLLDPFHVVSRKSDSYDPLADLRPDSPTLIDDARSIANAMILRTGREHDVHWVDGAEAFLTVIIVFVVISMKPEERHLQTVREIAADADLFQGAIVLMKESPACGGMVRRLACTLEHFKDREAASVKSTLGRNLTWLDSQPMRDVVIKSSFDPKQLRGGRLSVYVVLPPDKLKSHAAWMRMMVTGLLRTLIRLGPQETNKTLFLLDEAGHLGHVQALDDGLTLLRGYGVRLWFFYQAISQISASFPEDGLQRFLSNVDTQQFFGLNDMQTAEMVASRLGPATITNTSFQSGSSSSHAVGAHDPTAHPGQESTSTNLTYSEMARPLLNASEVLRLPERETVIFTKGLPPIHAGLTPYFEGVGGSSARPPQIASTVALALAAAIGWVFLGLLAWAVAKERSANAGFERPHVFPVSAPFRRSGGDFMP